MGCDRLELNLDISFSQFIIPASLGRDTLFFSEVVEFKRKS